jgi:protein-S-isoprenylcysteine O-methyltransferase Ste14
MLTPTLNILGVIFAFAASFGLFYFELAEPDSHFFLPIYLLILYYTVVAVSTNRKSYIVRPVWLAAKKALGKYIFWFALIGGLYLIYINHPFYATAVNARHMIWNFFQLFIIAGLPYFFFVERYRYSGFEIANDSYLRFISFLTILCRWDWPKLKYRLFARGYKSLFLSWVIRLHYIPVMVEQVHDNLVRIAGIISSPYYIYDVSGATALLVSILFCIDSTNASIGYFWESSLTGTRFRETDPHPFHWFVVLICYPPFIGFAGTFFPFPVGDARSPLLLSNPGFESAVNIATIVALSGMVFVTTTLGFSYSNLSYKKIQTKGLYRFVRHPGTVCKLFFFFFSIFRYKSSFNPTMLALYGFWLMIYITRAVCEERFLRQFQEYRSYMAKVRYRFIPGVL